MNDIWRSIAANHEMLDAIRIRKYTDAPVEALKEDLKISRSAADTIYKSLLGTNSSDSLITREGRLTKIRGSQAYFLGISIGGKHIRAELLDLNFEVVPPDFVEQLVHCTFEDIPGFIKGRKDSGYVFIPAVSPSESIFDLIRQITASLLERFLAAAKKAPEEFPLLGIGFSVSGPVDYDACVWNPTPRITQVRELSLSDLIGYQLLNEINQYGLFLSIDNNCKSAIISEYQYLMEQRQGRYKEDVALIYLGSGVGCAMVIDQKLLRGSHNLSGELGHIRIEGDEIENHLSDRRNHARYIPLVLNTINCILGIDRFILVGHDAFSNKTLIPELMDQRIQFTVTSTQQYCKAELGRQQASTAAIGAAMGAYFSMCNFNASFEDDRRINLANDISWKHIRQN